MYTSIKDKGLARRIKNHVIGKDHVFFAVVQPGFESTAGRELSGIGLHVADDIIEGGVEFTGRVDDCYRACIMSRTASRIFMRLGSFRSGRFELLEKDIAAFPWELYIPFGAQIVFRSSSRKSMIYHTGKLEEIFLRAIKNRLKDFRKEDVPLDASAPPSCLIHLRNDSDRCYASIDASGEFLFKRGQRTFVSRAPLRESTAALILFEAGVERYSRIIDPMCGAGTFSIEAAGILTGTAAAPDRVFPFFSWPCFKEKNFLHIKNDFLLQEVSFEKIDKEIITSDIDEKSFAAARLNCENFFPGMLKPVYKNFFDIKGPRENRGKTLLLLNPPYGKRLGSSRILDFYKKIGDKIREDFKGCGFAIIAPGVKFEKALALDFHRKIPFMNGGIRSAVLFRDA